MMFFADRSGVGRRLRAGASVLAIGLATAGQAWAQSDKTKDKDDAVVEEVVVVSTGTNIAGVKAVGSATVTLDRDDILATGLQNVHAVLQTVPQVQSNSGGGAAYREGGTSGYGGNPTQGTAINIRGIGYAATLTLVDGRRVAPSGASNAYTEAIQVPLAAIQRIDVITDGASAIYGADAVSGVVNFVLRKDFDGIEVSGRYEKNAVYEQYGFSVTGGTRWENALGQGNVILTADANRRPRGLRSQSPLLMQDLRAYGGQDNRMLNGQISSAGAGNIVTNVGGVYGYYGVPSGAGAGLTAAQLTGANVTDSADYTDYMPDLKRLQLAAFVNQDLNSWLSFFYEGFYTHRKAITHQFLPNNGGTSVTICQGSPFFPTGVTGATPQLACGFAPGVAYFPNWQRWLGPTLSSNPDTSWTQTVGLTAILPGSWKGEGYFTAGLNRGCGICNIGMNVNADALQAQINSGAINPYGTLTAAQRATFLGSNIQFTRNSLRDAVLKFNGPLFSLPGGKVRAAVGGEYSENTEHLTNGANRGVTNIQGVDNIAVNGRKVKSGFAELYVPVIGEDMNVPLVRSLAVDGAIRYDDYSDFGSTTNPKIGVTWKMVEDLSLRGSWGTSFRAPTLQDLDPNVFSAELIGSTTGPIPNLTGSSDFPATVQSLTLLGNNGNVKAEEAKTFSAGFDYTPSQVAGLRVSGTYYKIAYQNQIASPNAAVFLTSAANYALYKKFITPIHNPTTCVNGDPSTYDPALRDYLANRKALYVVNIAGYCAINAIYDTRATNLAETTQDGLDFSVNYARPTESGLWSFGVSVTKILNNKLKTDASAPSQNRLDVSNFPVSLRGRGNLGWAKGPWSANLFVNYVGGYDNTAALVVNGVTIGNAKVKSWTTFDGGVAYVVPAQSPLAFAKGLRLSLNVQNLTDKDPPLAITAGSVFDASYANPLGRQWALQLTKSF